MKTDCTPTGLSTMSPEMENARNYNYWVFSKFKNYINRNILEVGTGYGNFAQYIPFYESYVAIDIDEKVVERLRKEENKRIIITLDVASDDFYKKLSVYNIDTVICINVLEHVFEHQKAFRNMMSILAKGGHLLLFVPAANYLFNDMDELAGHYRRYTKKLCRSLFKDSDYQLIKMEYFNPIGAAGWWTNKFFRHRKLDSTRVNNQVRLFDKYLIHLSKLVNPLTKSFFGQSLVCIYKKK